MNANRIRRIFAVSILFMLCISYLSVFTFPAEASTVTIGSTAVEAGFDSFDFTGYTYIVGRYQATFSGTLTSISIYAQSATSGDVHAKAVVYSNNASNQPDTRLGLGDSVLFTGGNAWRTLTGLSVAVTAGQYYWFGVYLENLHGAASLYINNATDASYSQSSFNGVPPASWTSALASEHNRYSLYASETTTDAPTASNMAASSTTLGTYTILSASWTTNGALSHYIFSWNYSGSWTNSSAIAFSDANSYFNISLGTDASNVGTTVGWQYYANNTADNWNTTGVQTFTVTLPDPYYIIQGVYYESGAVATTTNNVTAYYTNGVTEVYTLDSTGGVADSVLLNPSYTPDYVTWVDASNYTRMFEFIGTSETAYIYISHPDYPSYPYTFSITDFYGMQNPYLETTTVIGSTTHIIERKNINTVGTVSFIMTQWKSYGLRFRCDQGLYALTFSAENSFTTSLPVLTCAFPTSNTTLPEAYALRVNGTAIEVGYTDPDNSTSWVHIQITHRYGTQTIVDSTDNQTVSDTYTTTWNSGDNSTDYIVTVTALKDNSTITWSFICQAPFTITNPIGDLMDGFGTWPAGVAANTLPAAALMLFAIGIFSYRSAGIACFAGLIIGGIFMGMGWWTTGLSTFGFSAFIAFIVWITEAKREEPSY